MKRCSKKFIELFAKEVTKSMFEHMLEPGMVGYNFTWENFWNNMYPTQVRMQLMMTGLSTWEKHYPNILALGYIELEKLYIQNNIEVPK